MAKFVKQFELNTEYCADSVEWCPIEGFRHILACGTYELETKGGSHNNQPSSSSSSKRLGRLYLFQLSNENNFLEEIQSIETQAILDMKWAGNKSSGKVILAVANAVGEIIVYEIKEDNILLTLVTKYTLDSPDTLALSLDWSMGSLGSDINELAVSDSEGFITILEFTTSFELNRKLKWKAHQFEAWIVSFNYHNPKLIYTGGDDSKMNVYDISMSVDRPVISSKEHTSGVTSMHYCSLKENVFVSGSYDEKIRFWDVRNMRHPVNSINVGGGIWRLKWEPSQSRLLSAACMYNGFFVLDADKYKIISEYKEHESIAYGVDWCHLERKQIGQLFSTEAYLKAACSFYDRKLSLATLEVD